MTKDTRILVLEDLLTEANLITKMLQDTELSLKIERVETKVDFLNSLKEFAPDIIVSCYSLRDFIAPEALRLLKALKINIPFILYGAVSTEAAVKCMKLGAADCISKPDSDQLSTTIVNALKNRPVQKEAEDYTTALRESEYTLRNLLENMNEALLQVNRKEVISFVNARFCEMTGYRREELIGKIAGDILFEKEGCKAIVQSGDELDEERSSRYEIRLKRKTGEAIWTIVSKTPITNAEGLFTGSMKIFTDITERKQAEEKLLHDALHDALTGLANRTLFMHHLRKTIDWGKRHSKSLYAVLFLDFDRFKVINDSLGHAEGDKLLKYIARRLETSTRVTDLVARLGGDEFVILLGDLHDTGEALFIAERILNDLKSSFDLGGSEVFISTSIGITLSSSGHTRAEDMLRDADTAMYRAKANGKAQYQVFDQEMHQQAVMQLKFETDMRHALERHEFCLYYQPIINIEKNALVGFESLVRWKHPERGMVAPVVFIPTAEENRLILPLGRWILHESCRQLRQWQIENPSAENLTVSVNLSCKQFLQPDLVEQVASILRETKLDPQCLKLEITETHIMENTEAAVATMNRLRALGIELSLDDFGTGYSSLSYLHRLPIDYLKIDRSFVSRMSESKENAEIVYTIIRLAQSLKMRVIAEGIETDEQLAQLHLLNCEFGQGYFFSKPLEAEKVKAFIDDTFKNMPYFGNHPVTNLELNM